MIATIAARAALLAALLLAAPLRAESYTYRLDPAATKVTFLLDAFMHKVHGTASLTRGEVRFDDSGKAEGEIVVDATKAATGNDGRDQDMHTKVLESAKFKEIVLAVDGFEGKFDPAAPSKVTVKGRFRIHGVEHPAHARDGADAARRRRREAARRRPPPSPCPTSSGA